MHNMKRFWTLLIGLLLVAIANAQNNKVLLNGREYYMHIIRQGETLSAISRQYEVPVDTLIADNPQAAYVIHPNQYIKVRVKQEPVVSSSYIYHKVEKGDTPYNLSKRYGCSVAELYELNPGSELGIRIGDRLRFCTQEVAENNEQKTVAQEQVIDDNSFILHVVKKQETLFGISRQYHVSVEEIEELNQEIKTRAIQIGESLKIPAKEAVAAIDEEECDWHKVATQETIYGIARKYNISDKQILKLNPDLKKRGLQDGEIIRIPKGSSMVLSETEKIAKVDSSVIKQKEQEQLRIIDYSANKQEMVDFMNAQIDTEKSYNVAFFLPLYLNMCDTIGWGDGSGKIYGKSKMFVDFYIGAMMALQDLKSKGMSFNVKVIDTRGDSTYVANYLKTTDLSNFDLFIGPAFSGELSVVGDYAWEHQINIVSPLSVKNDFITHNPYAFQVSPSFDIQMKYVAEFLTQVDSKNYIVIHNGNSQEQDYISEFKRQLYSTISSENLDQVRYHEYYYFNANGDLLNSAFVKGKENIVIIPSTDRSFVTDVIGKINGYSYEYDITVFGQSRWEMFESIDIDNLFNTNMHFLSNSYINYTEPQIIEFVSQFRNMFKLEPSKTAFQAYDITTYFCSALNKYGKDFRRAIMFHKVPLLQTSLNFMPTTDQGGYQNTAIFIVNYAKDYQIKKVATYPEN